MSAEAQQPTSDNPNQQVDYLSENITNYCENINEAVWMTIGSVAAGAFSGFTAIAESLSNSSMRGGEIALATVSATSLFIGSVAFGDYRRKHHQLFELKKLKAEALKELRD